MFVKYLFLFLGFFSFLEGDLRANPILYSIVNPINAGEMSQSEGIKTALVRYNPTISSEFLDARKPDVIAPTIAAALKNNQTVIVVGVGEDGITGIQQLAPHSHLMICLASHMVLERYRGPALLKQVDFIALPTHAVSTEDKNLIGSKLIETVGVSHNRTVPAVEDTYRKWGQELPSCSAYLGVVLGGDALLPSPAKGMQWFTSEDVVKLAAYVSQRAKTTKECVVILNGPRTGKYDVDQQEIFTVHRKGYSDPLTELFAQTLKDHGVQATLFDFQHKIPDNELWVRPYNSFDLIVGALRAHEGLLLVPGESTSMISEAIDTLPREKILVYQNSAMNAVHTAHVRSEHEAGRVAVLENYSKIIEPSSSAQGPTPNAAELIAQRIGDAVKSK